MQDARDVRRAAWLGAVAALGPACILLGWYYAKHQALPLPWLKTMLITIVLAPFTGAAFGGAIRALIALSDRCARWRWLANPISAGVAGGAIASVVAGVFAVAVFGSYHGPYAGSVEITVMTVVACTSLATLLAVEALRARRAPRGSDLMVAGLLVIVAAIATAAVTLIAARMLAPSLVRDGIFLYTKRLALEAGSILVGGALGAIVGAIVGLHLGITIQLARWFAPAQLQAADVRS